jgi:HAD superfamily hydrolase (TIGR01509 family)
MDGTIVDTEPYWMRAETVLVGSFGGTWTHDDALQLVGQGLWHSSRILQAHGVDLAEDEIVDRLTTTVMEQVTEQVPWRPGAMELLAEVRAAGIPTALVTMSLRSLAELVVSSIDFASFDVIVSGDDVTHAKPHPEPYLTAAGLLGVDIAECVALEDSLPGLASAVASGAVSIGIPHMATIGESSEHTLWTTLEGRTITDISDVYTAGRARNRP